MPFCNECVHFIPGQPRCLQDIRQYTTNVVAISRMKGEDELQAKLDKLKRLGKKYSKATEFFDNLIYCTWRQLSPTSKGFINQIGREVLGIINE